jgi:hypothetical protein
VHIPNVHISTPVTRVPRHLTAMHAFAMAIVRNFGRLALFVTHVQLETDWEEITREMRPVGEFGESVYDDLGASGPPMVAPVRAYAFVRFEAQSRGVVHRHNAAGVSAIVSFGGCVLTVGIMIAQARHKGGCTLLTPLRSARALILDVTPYSFRVRGHPY